MCDQQDLLIVIKMTLEKGRSIESFDAQMWVFFHVFVPLLGGKV